MFDVAAAAPLKRAFKLELDWEISCFTACNPGERDKTQILRRLLTESFINGSHNGPTPANIISGFWATGVIPFNPEVIWEAQFAIDLIYLELFTIHGTGAEINAMVPTFPSGVDFLCRYELKRSVEDADHNINDIQVWEDLKRNSVTQSWPSSNPTSMFLCLDANTIR
jgi:hypothetical protein